MACCAPTNSELGREGGGGGRVGFKPPKTKTPSAFSRLFSCCRVPRRNANPGPRAMRNMANNDQNNEPSLHSHPSMAGGEDLWNEDSVKDDRFPEHLIVMANGIIGSASNWRFAAEQFVKRMPDKVVVYCSESNSSTLTFDGVDLMGNRLAEEVRNVIQSKPGVKKISFVGHSLGGLVVRYAIGLLYEPSDEKELNGKIAGLEPVNFITFATPHLGSRGHRQLPLLCGFTFLERAALQSAHWFVGRTGRHLFLTDKDDGKPPLLLRMVSDCGDLYFMSALRSFERRVAYANVNYDHMVGWQTSSIRHHCELPKLDTVPVNAKYPHVLNVEDGNNLDNISKLDAVGKDEKIDAMEEEMIVKLTQVPWERIDVSFQGSTQRFLAHSTIQNTSSISARVISVFMTLIKGVDMSFLMDNSPTSKYAITIFTFKSLLTE